ncbi:MAG: type II toxin-antitoxin system prevent-host-death family antitoxin [Steroidobacteraceae bacterium]
MGSIQNAKLLIPKSDQTRLRSMVVNIYEAKTQLSRLVDQAAAGTDVIIARGGKPVARLTALEAPERKILFGLLKGRVKVAEDFDAPLPPDVLAAFEGR